MDIVLFPIDIRSCRNYYHSNSINGEERSILCLHTPSTISTNAKIDHWKLTITIDLTGCASPYLIDARTLEQAANHVNHRYLDSKMPTAGSTTEEIRQLISTTIGRKDTKVIINLNFPLYSVNYYHLYRSTLLLPQGNRSSAYIKPPKEYLMIIQGQHNHTLLSNEDLQDCIKGPGKWYCVPPAILLSTSCELQLLMDSTRIKSDHLQHRK